MKHLFDFINFQKHHSYYIGVTLLLEWNFGFPQVITNLSIEMSENILSKH